MPPRQHVTLVPASPHPSHIGPAPPMSPQAVAARLSPGRRRGGPGVATGGAGRAGTAGCDVRVTGAGEPPDAGEGRAVRRPAHMVPAGGGVPLPARDPSGMEVSRTRRPGVHGGPGSLTGRPDRVRRRPHARVGRPRVRVRRARMRVRRAPAGVGRTPARIGWPPAGVVVVPARIRRRAHGRIPGVATRMARHGHAVVLRARRGETLLGRGDADAARTAVDRRARRPRTARPRRLRGGDRLGRQSGRRRLRRGTGRDGG